MSFNKRMLSAGAAPFVPSEHFKVVTYTGTGAARSITGVGFKPDLVWIKHRGGTGSHSWTDSSRGNNLVLQSNETSAEASGQITLDSDGFTIGNNNALRNTNGETYVAWCWKAGGGTTSSNTDGTITTTVQANTAAGFSIFTYTGTGNDATLGHGLDSDPQFVTIKTRSHTSDWPVFHNNLGGAEYRLKLNSSDARDTTNNPWDSTDPNSTVITINGSAGNVNTFPRTYVGYAWHSVEGFSKIGTYQGNASTNGPIVNTGFEPAWLMIRRWESGDNWYIVDNVRSTSNPRQNALFANLNDGEYPTYGAKVDFLSNGFKIVSTDNATNANEAYVYMAFAADPDEEAPALADSFNIRTYKGTKPNSQNIDGFGFDPNFVWIKNRDATDHWSVFDTIRGNTALLQVNDAGAEQAFSAFDFITDGFSIANSGQANESGDDLVSYGWKANDNEPTYNTTGSTNSITSVNANAGFSMVSFTGTGSNATVAHGLSSAPDMIIFKNRDASASWLVYHTSVGNEHGLYMETNGAKTDSNAFFQDTSPTSTVFSVGTHADPNGNTHRIMAYCFHAVTGYSKFGSYSGSGSNGNAVTLGFKPDFVLIKRINDTGGWLLFDSKRSIGGTADDRLEVDNTSSETADSNSKWLSFKATTFEANGSDTEVNASGSTYIYAAFAQNITSNTTLANSFNVKTWTGTGSAKSITGLGFRPDLVWIKSRSHATSHELNDSLRGQPSRLFSDTTAAAATSYNGFVSLDSGGFSLDGTGSGGEVNTSGRTYVGWAWKAGNTWESNIDGTIPSLVNANTANGFSIVKYTGTGSSGTVGHGLNAAPTLIIAKNLDTAGGGGNWDGWPVYSSTIGNDRLLNLSGSSASESTGGTWGSTTPTSTVFTVQDNNDNNKDGDEIIAYCFHSVSGFSKIGSYSGTGSSNGITGVGFKPGFVLIKEHDGGDSWQIYDSIRGAGNVVYPNGNNAEYAGSELTSFDSDGFTVSGNSSNNESGKNYIYATFKINVTGLMSWLCVGGGGEGGGESNSGGGGAGGLRTSYGAISGGGGNPESDITLAAGTYTITVGAGGSGNQTLGGDGGDSSIAKSGMTTITSAGGGGGAGQSGNPSGRAGGSGGGGGYNNQAGGSGTSNQGYAGGAGVASNPHPGGGGGGAGEAGNTDGNGHGGDGLAVSITGSSVTYAGGGSGGVSAGNSAIAGSAGGGGAGAAGNDPAPGAGTANTGSGGGGGAAETKGGDGGSGVVILRLLTSEYSGSTTGSPTVTTDGDYTVIKYTSSGTYVHS